MRKQLVFVTLGVITYLSVSTSFGDTLDDIQKRGALRWGGDDQGGGPYIFEDKDRKITGFEFDLAEYLAKELGVHSELVTSEWEMLPQKLDRGGIDIVLNGYEWSKEREQSWSSTIPYYIYNLQLMARKGDASIGTWQDLRAPKDQPRKRIGVLRDSAAERYVDEQFGEAVDLKGYPEIINVMKLVEERRLDATVQDVPISVFYGHDFPGLRNVDRPVAPGYYVALVRRGDERLRQKLNDALLKAMNDGTLKRIYDKYGLWSDAQRHLTEVAKNWPPASEAQPSRWTNFPYYVSLLLIASWTTIKLACLSMPLAIMIGLLVAVGRLYGPRSLAIGLEAYVEFLRGTPLLLQLFVIYYVLPRFTGITIPEFWAGVLGLAINYSAYEAENYRAGLLAIPRGQMEAALSLGMSTPAALRRVIIPQAMRIVIPPVTNDFIALFKDTSVCTMISVVELTGMYRKLFNDHPQMMLEFGMITALLYLAMSYPLSLVARRMEVRFERSQRDEQSPIRTRIAPDNHPAPDLIKSS
jgi:polar amino acid transport system substrate-binding protein